MTELLVLFLGILLMGVILFWTVRRDWRLWRGKLLFYNHPTIPDVIDRMTGIEFETWVQQLFFKIGAQAKVTPSRGDHGIDLIVKYENKKICVQCKKYFKIPGHYKFNGLVGEPSLRDLYGTKHAGGYDLAILVTTGQLSNAAKRWVRGKKDLVIVDGKLLSEILSDPSVLAKLITR